MFGAYKITALCALLVFLGCHMPRMAWGAPAESAEGHVILAGDRLRVTVAEEPDISKVYAVAGDGSIDFGFIGRVIIGELTVRDASIKLEEILEENYYKSATVSIDIADFVEGNILVLGEVKSPGSIPFRGDQMVTLMEAIIVSGGLSRNAAGSEVRILRWRPGAGLQREVIKVDVRTILEDLDFSKDQFLRPRDIIMVPGLRGGEGAQEYLVLGEVGSPGFYPYAKGMDIIRAVTVAGFSRSAMIDAVRVLRPNEAGEYTPITVDLARLFGAADMSMNIPIQPGDIIFVPSSAQSSRGKVYLLGQVSKPGTLSLPLGEEATLAKMMLNHGGISEYGNAAKVKILRKAPDGSKQVLYVNVEKILKDGSFEDDVPLEDEDVIIVPERLFGL